MPEPHRLLGDARCAAAGADRDRRGGNTSASWSSHPPYLQRHRRGEGHPGNVISGPLRSTSIRLLGWRRKNAAREIRPGSPGARSGSSGTPRRGLTLVARRCSRSSRRVAAARHRLRRQGDRRRGGRRRRATRRCAGCSSSSAWSPRRRSCSAALGARAASSSARGSASTSTSMILEKALDARSAPLRGPEFYDKLTRARREASSRPLSLVTETFQLAAERADAGGYVALLRRASRGWAVLGAAGRDGPRDRRRDALLAARPSACATGARPRRGASTTSSTCSPTTSTPRR